MDILINLASILLPLFIVLVPKGNLTQAVVSSGGKDTLTLYEKIYCYIPIYNSFLIRRTLYGSSPLVLIYFYASAVLLAANMIVRIWLYESPMLMLIMTIAILAWLVITGIVEAWVVTETALLFSGPKWILVTILVSPVGAWIITPKVKEYFNANKHEIQGTFEERKV